VVATHDERLARAAGLEVLAIRWQREADDSVGACLEDVG
ncbi:ABC transporter ATP-binding protein, partial [Pseudomonas aeruginosa]|nr:ABC transporter ATP-binding protein [Pseudomonas aeruginosa]